MTELSPQPLGSPSRGWPEPIFCVLAVSALSALAVDLPIAEWLRQDPSPLPKMLTHVVVWSEAFAQAVGVGIFALAVFILDPARRVAVPRLLTMAWGSGLTADLLKLSIRRLRPREFDYAGGVFDTFGPLWNVGHGHGGQGFPSAHAASAVGLAVALTWLYPRGRFLFAGLAILACMQRMETGAHFLSDVLAGAAVGYLFARACIGQGRLAERFERWEATWQGTRPAAD